MRQIAFALVAAAALAGVAGPMSRASGQDGEAAPITGLKIPSGYRDWRLIAVAHEEGTLVDLRAILGNDIAVKAARDGTRPFPDGAIIARLALSYDLLTESRQAFGHPQSFVSGSPKNRVQFMVKDRSKFAATGGWGFVQSTTASPPLKRCKRPVLAAIRSSRSATSSSIATRLDGAQQVGALDRMTEDLFNLTGRKPFSMHDSVKRHAAEFTRDCNAA
jgi:hypothetical protein